MLYCAGIIAFPFIVILLLFIVYYIIPNYPQVECFFVTQFNMYCPGCGGTRALLAFVEGHFLRSVWYHPLIMYSVVMYLAYMITHTCERLHIPHVKGMRFRLSYLYVALIILVGNFILKNVLKFGFDIVM